MRYLFYVVAYVISTLLVLMFNAFVVGVASSMVFGSLGLLALVLGFIPSTEGFVMFWVRLSLLVTSILTFMSAWSAFPRYIHTVRKNNGGKA